MMKKALIGAKVFTGDGFLDKHAVIISEENILDVLPETEVDTSISVKDLKGGIIAPGFIDLQVNGGGGAFFTSDPNVKCIHTMVNAHRKFGTTSLLPTLISDTRQVHQAGVEAVVEAINANHKSVLGVHIEGPFFEPSRRGAHKESYIRQLEQADIDWLIAASTNIKSSAKIMLTLAPEHTAIGQIQQLTSAGIVVCAGHTDASYESVMVAINEGLQGFTHLYNAMRPTTAREPGVVGAALENADTWCGIIIDGHHVHSASARIAYAIKPKGKMYLVTDAMSTLGAADKSFELYGETIYERQDNQAQNSCLVNAEGRLAGSAIGMMDAVRLNTEWVGVDLAESLRMASLYPAEFMKVDHYLGRIQPGYRGDLVHFTHDYRVTQTWVAGAN